MYMCMYLCMCVSVCACVLSCITFLISLVRFLNYLADLCVSKGTAVQTIQMMVCTTVLDEFNMNVLMQIE